MESLFNLESSLFRDASGPLSPAYKPAASAGDLDGWTEFGEAGSPLASTPTEPLSPVNQYQDGHPFGLSWLDTRVDLLDYLAGPELEGLNHSEPEPLKLALPMVVDPTARAVQVLQSIAEENDSLLCYSTSSPPSVAHPATPQHSMLGTDILDLIDDLANPSSVLAPMSPEDIDLILSEPSSPASTSADDSFSSLASLLTQATSSDSEPADVDIDMLMLLSQVQAHEDEIKSDSEGVISVLPALLIQSEPISPIPVEEPLVKTHRPKPYERPRKPGSTKGLPREVIQQERKMRKKQQNKDAATRYRQKKKAEATTVDSEVQGLEDRNTSLKESVESMTKEISYLKDLLVEVYQARGLSLPFKSK